MPQFKERNDLYQILGLQNFALIDDIKKSYRKLALKHHPDRGGDLKIMQNINHAYEVLTKFKAQYDTALKNYLNPAPVWEFVYTYQGSYATDSTTGGYYSW